MKEEQWEEEEGEEEVYCVWVEAKWTDVRSASYSLSHQTLSTFISHSDVNKQLKGQKDSS